MLHAVLLSLLPAAALRPILTVGDPRLEVIASPVADPSDALLANEIEELHAVLDDFRERKGSNRNRTSATARQQ